MNNSDNHSTSPRLISSISQSEIYEAITSDASTAPKSLASERWKRQHRTLAPVGDHHHFAGILNAKSAEQIQAELQKFKDNLHQSELDQVQTQKRTRTLSHAYNKAIEMCGHLRHFEQGRNLFEEAKQNKDIINRQVFAAVIRIMLQEDLSKESLTKCMQICSEMKQQFDLNPNARIYIQLITDAMTLKQYQIASSLVHEVVNLDESYKLPLFRDGNPGKFLIITIVKFYSEGKKIQKALQFLSYIANNLGHEHIQQEMFATVLRGIARCVEDGNQSMVDIAESLFQQSFEVLTDRPNEHVFCALMNVYSAAADFRSCMDVLRAMKENEEWPNPTAVSFATCLKALRKAGMREAFESDQGWKYVDEILQQTQLAQVELNEAAYSTLFNLCSGSFCDRPDIERLYRYYDRLQQDVSNGNAKFNLSTAESLILSGLDYFAWQFDGEEEEKEKELVKQECKKFVDWALLQYKQHQIPFIQSHQNKVERKLQHIFAS